MPDASGPQSTSTCRLDVVPSPEGVHRLAHALVLLLPEPCVQDAAPYLRERGNPRRFPGAQPDEVPAVARAHGAGPPAEREVVEGVREAAPERTSSRRRRPGEVGAVDERLAASGAGIRATSAQLVEERGGVSSRRGAARVVAQIHVSE